MEVKLDLKMFQELNLEQKSITWSAKLNNEDTALLGIYQLPDAKCFRCSTKIKEKIDSLTNRFPEGLRCWSNIRYNKICWSIN